MINDIDRYYESLADFGAWNDCLIAQTDIDHAVAQMDSASGSHLPEIVERVAQRLMREAAAESGAVERIYDLAPGETHTIATEGEGWQGLLLVQGETSLNTFKSTYNAYEQVRQEATGGSLPNISQVYIRHLHEIVCARQGSYTALTEDGRVHEVILNRGEYKKNPNHVILRHGELVSYAPVADTAHEMSRFVDEMGGSIFWSANPVVQIAYAHYGLTHIHPFADGNGRVARVLASLFSYYAYRIPLVIYADRKLAYFQALENADAGSPQVFVDYVTDRLIDTLGHVRQELDYHAQPSISKYLAEILEVVASHSEITVSSAETVGHQLAECIEKRIEGFGSHLAEHSQEYIVPSRSSLSSFSDLSYNVDSGKYRQLWGSSVGISLLRPAEVRSSVNIGLLIAKDLATRFTYKLVAKAPSPPGWHDPPDAAVDFRFEDVNPHPSTNSFDKIDLVIQRCGSILLENLQQELSKALKQAGYE